MAYDDLTEREQPILRDYLAAERTHLANERTLLAYLRSALLLFVTSLTIIKLFESETIIRNIGFGFVPLSLFVGIFGICRFRSTRKKLSALNRDKNVLS